MNQESFHPTEENEISLGEILRDLYAHKVFLLGFPFVVGLMVAAYTLTKSNTYGSAAGIIIREPEIRMTGEASTLSPEMLLALVNSTEVKRTAYDRAIAEGYLEKGDAFETFQARLKCAVEKSPPPKPVLLPMMKLSATAKDPKAASDYANIWAEVAIEKSNEIYSSGVENLSRFAAEFFKQADVKRASAELELASQTVAADIDLLQSQLKNNLDSCVSLDQEVLILDASIVMSASLIQDILGRLEEQQVNGDWVGEALEREYQDLVRGSTNEADSRALSIGGESDNVIVARIDEVVRELVTRNLELLDFLKKNQVGTRKLELDNAVTELDSIVKEIASSSRELTYKRMQYDAYLKEASGIAEKIVLQRSPTETAFWGAAFQGLLDSKKPIPGLQNEEKNPLFFSLKEETIALAVSVNSLEKQVGDLATRHGNLTDFIEDASEEVALLDLEIERRQRGIEREQSMLDLMKEDYEDEAKEAERLERKLRRYRAEKDFRASTLRNLLDERRTLQKSLTRNEIKIAAYQREVDEMSQISKSIAAKTQEIQLLQVAGADQSRSGATLLYRADINPLKIGPMRTRTVLIGMIVAFGAACAFVLLRKMAESA